MRKLCECGCGQEVARDGNRFIHSHNSNTEEVRNMYHEMFLGEKGTRFNVPVLEETRAKLRKSATREHSPERVQKMLDGINRPEVIKRLRELNLGKHHTEETKRKLSEYLIQRWKDPISAKVLWDSRALSPNKSELKLTNIVQELNLPYKFVGDGQFILGGKCPDYLNVNGQKKLIELFGDFWHGYKITGYSIEENIKRRIDFFAQFGFSTLIIKESELKDIEFVKNKLVKFDLENAHAVS